MPLSRRDAAVVAGPVRLDAAAATLLRNPTRLRIVQAAGRPVSAREIAGALRVPVTRIYHHLDRLVGARLLTVTDERKEGTSVTRLYHAANLDFTATADTAQITAAVTDALADLTASGTGSGPGSSTGTGAGTEARTGARRHAGRIVSPIPAQAVDRAIAAIEQIVADINTATDPDADLVGFTYILAPLRRPDSGYQIRPGTAADLPVYQRALYEAMSWNPARALPPIEQTLAHPQLAIYHQKWGRAGDLAVVATATGGQPAGAAFCRLFTDTEHGHGYLDQHTPEIAIAVWPDHRNRGLGQRLLAALADTARAAGYHHLSLSVDTDNPATRLYHRCGYHTVRTDAGGHVMTTTL